jgi:outer membrane protein TolC
MRLLLALLVAAPAASLAAPLTLDDALALAGRENRSLALAREDRAAASADAYGSYAGVLPRLDVSARFGRSFLGGTTQVRVVPVVDPVTGDITGFGQESVATPASDFADYDLGATLRQPIFDGFANTSRIAAARLRERAADRGVDEQTLAVAFDVTRRFYDLVKAQESLRVLEETVRRSEELVTRAEALFAAGRGPRSDVVQAQLSLQNDRISVETQRATVAQAQAQVAVALGQDATADIEAVPPAELVSAATAGLGEPPPVDVLLTRARDRRPLLAAQGALASAAERDVTIARAGYWPTLSAQASYSRAGQELFGTEGVYGDPTRQYSANAGLVLSWNIFSGRETSAGVQRASASERRARLELEQAALEVSAELASARANVVAQQRAARLAADAVAQAELGERLARERWEAGATTQLEVRDAALRLTQARLTLVSARVDHVVARADLSRAAGGMTE